MTLPDNNDALMSRHRDYVESIRNEKPMLAQNKFHNPPSTLDTSLLPLWLGNTDAERLAQAMEFYEKYNIILTDSSRK